jgi:DNA-binding MarR family transcriptional regulator
MNVGRLNPLADHVAGQCIALRVRALNRLITNVYNARLSGTGVTISQFSILTAIIKSQPVGPAKIGAILHLEKSTLSRNLDLMRRRGWIDLAGTRRAQRISLTRGGAETYARAFPQWQAAQDEVSRMVGPAAQTLADLVQRAGKN